MNKTIKKVFMIVGLLVAIFIAWQLIFNSGGILRTGYNALVSGVNDQWAKVSGDGKTILATWSDSTAADNGKGFTMDTTAGSKGD